MIENKCKCDTYDDAYGKQICSTFRPAKVSIGEFEFEDNDLCNCGHKKYCHQEMNDD